MSRVILAMSGGVDSSVAAALLLEAGHEVIGLFMRHGETAPVSCATADAQQGAVLPVIAAPTSHRQGCCSAADADDARRVAERLDVPFYALNFDEQFGRIMDYFVEEYTNARTPNPCVMCNNWLKFGKLFEYADSVGAEFVATGHYARLLPDEHGGPPRLCRGVDEDKDQSYVLFGIDPKFLSRMMLPVGGYRKAEIRRKAGELGLDVADKQDSQEICFVTSGHHDEFVRQRRGNEDTAGEIVTTDGRVVGQHPGIERFTIGQRKGLGVALGEPRFVVRIEADTHRVVIGAREDLARDELYADRVNWLVGGVSDGDLGGDNRGSPSETPPTTTFRCHAQIRYNSTASPATVRVLADHRLHIKFDEPRYGVAPGQAVVLYDDDRVLGGGWIE
ncbi:MAG: tRNA 2-thiouridine(34) synthase MnmA [Planctomycetes bacterium]|nr:tRNA 2-thiouridine(34) synthase MnmA [Planctomycetota bacterium]